MKKKLKKLKKKSWWKKSWQNWRRKSWKSFKREMRFSTFAKKRKIRPLHFSTVAKNREICPSHLSIFEEKNAKIRFCIYVTALNDDYDDFDQSLPWMAEGDKKRHCFVSTLSLSRWPEEEWMRPLSKLLKECQVRQLWWRFQILVTFTMGPLRFLRLNGPVVSEFAFWTSPK